MGVTSRGGCLRGQTPPAADAAGHEGLLDARPVPLLASAGGDKTHLCTDLLLSSAVVAPSSVGDHY